MEDGAKEKNQSGEFWKKDDPVVKFVATDKKDDARALVIEIWDYWRGKTHRHDKFAGMLERAQRIAEEPQGE